MCRYYAMRSLLAGQLESSGNFVGPNECRLYYECAVQINARSFALYCLRRRHHHHHLSINFNLAFRLSS